MSERVRLGPCADQVKQKPCVNLHMAFSFLILRVESKFDIASLDFSRLLAAGALSKVRLAFASHVPQQKTACKLLCGGFSLRLGSATSDFRAESEI